MYRPEEGQSPGSFSIRPPTEAWESEKSVGFVKVAASSRLLKLIDIQQHKLTQYQQLATDTPKH